MVGRLHSAARAVELGFTHRTGQRAVGEPAPLAHRRRPRRGVRPVLQALRRDRRLPRRDRPRRLPGPGGRRPRVPGGEAPHRRRRADADLARRAGLPSAGPSNASSPRSRPPASPSPTLPFPLTDERDRRAGRRGPRHRRRPHGPPQGLHPHPPHRRRRPAPLRPRPGRARPGPRPHPRQPGRRPAPRRRRPSTSRPTPPSRSWPPSRPSPTAVERLADRPGPALADRRRRRRRRWPRRPRSAGRSPPGQCDVVEAVCSSGRAVDVVVGVAGSGKTTALDAATTALEPAGYRVLGTSTSGQAARTLGDRGPHRVPHHHLAALAPRPRPDHPRRPHRRDPRRSRHDRRRRPPPPRRSPSSGRGRSSSSSATPASSPPSAPAAPSPRSSSATPRSSPPSTDNVRQRDPAERRALAELRHGDVARGRRLVPHAGAAPPVSPTAPRPSSRWPRPGPHDVAAGHDTALLAWRRDDVRDLNRLARDLHWDQLGQAHRDPTSIAPGGRPYAAGDQVVAPRPQPRTSASSPASASPSPTSTPRRPAHAPAPTDGRPVVLDRRGDRRRAPRPRLRPHRPPRPGRHLRPRPRPRRRRRPRARLRRPQPSPHRHHPPRHRRRPRPSRHDLQADWSDDHHQRWITDTPADVGQHPDPIRADLDELQDLLSERFPPNLDPRDEALSKRDRILRRLDRLQAKSRDTGLGL